MKPEPEKPAVKVPISGSGEISIGEKEEGMNIDKTPPVAQKPISGWQKKFLGIPFWGWIIMGAILVWALITVAIVAGH